jgi:hypothetical protein
MSTYQQAINKYQNKSRTKPKRYCSLLTLTKIKTLTLKTKKQRSKEVEVWSLPILRVAMLAEDYWIIEVDVASVNQQVGPE